MPKHVKRVRQDSHRAVLDYLSSDRSLVDILRSIPEPHTPVVRALLYIHECLARKRLAKQAIEAAQAVPVEEADADLLILMLSSWAELSCRMARPSEAGALVQRAKALVAESTPPEIRAAAVYAESMVDDNAGNKGRAEEKLKSILDLIPPSSPRRKFYVWEAGMFLAQQGRAIEFESDLRALESQQSDHFPAVRLIALQFVDAVETGRVEDALQIDSQISAALRLGENPAAVTCGNYQALLRLMEERATRDRTPMAAPSPSVLGYPAWLEIVRCLLRRQTTHALRLARREADRTLASLMGNGFDSFNLIRAELAAGNADAARRLLEMRRTRGNLHYLDSLFMARVERLAGNPAAAARRFAEMLRTVEHYRANGRLEFELQMACELSYSDVIRMTQMSGSVARQLPSVRLPFQIPPPVDAPPEHGVERIIGRSPAIVAIRDMILRLADADAPVLITGETGTGKELVARALHASSRRREAPFIAVNCGSIAETLLDSELFGHKRGAFTGADRANKGLFEEAGDGAILLDEMGEILPRLQQALLRVLETGEIRAVGSATTRRIRCRILAATNADLNRLAAEGRFRKDLLFRLQRLGIDLPPLRDRREDILLLARHFLDLGRPPGMHATLSGDLIRALESYEWPGNVRELRHAAGPVHPLRQALLRHRRA